MSDDGEWMIFRLSAFYETMKSGQFPVRLIGRLNNSYGYPVANFIYPGYLYLGTIVHILGFGFITTTKIIFGASMLASGVFSYFWLKKLFPKIAAFFAALLYVYMPYHLFDLYQRGSIGEVLALAIVPYILWQMERRSIMLTSIGIALLVLSHNTLAFLFMGPLFLYSMFRDARTGIKSIVFTSIPFIVGALLSLFFWFPAIYDLQYTRFHSVTVSDWQQYFADSLLIGYASIAILFLSTLSVLRKSSQKASYESIFYLFLLMGILGIFLATPVSTAIWQVLPVGIVQFPFRALSLLMPSVAFLAAFLLLSITHTGKQIGVGIVLVSIAIMTCMPFLFPRGYIYEDEIYYIANFSTTTTKDEYMPKWVTRFLPPMESKKIESMQEGKIVQEHIEATRITAKIESQRGTEIKIQMVYFPGWTAFVDGKKMPIVIDEQYGFMRVKIPPGSHFFTISYEQTFLHTIVNAISMATCMVLLIMFLVKMRYNKQWLKI